ncbi:MAG: substrate-binding domain-containing protein [Acidobacteria bacterium]|nr:substrate-binding domain-containing protein [Acidobacteriota bacterium]
MQTPVTNVQNRDRNAAQAVVRACGILKCFRREGEVLQLADVVNRTGLSRTTAFRLLTSLVQGGIMERVARGEYRCLVRTGFSQSIRLGFAAQANSVFSQTVSEGLQRAAAANDRIHLIMVNNRYSAREALRNAEHLVRERVNLVLEFQTYQRVAPSIAACFLEANIPVIAIEIPHPGATYYGANNYEAGLIAGRALGRWAKKQWPEGAEQLLLLELPIAGPLPGLRITGTVEGLRTELPGFDRLNPIHLDGKGDFEQILGVVRRFIARSKPKRTLVGAVNDMCALAALRGFEEAGVGHLCAVVGQNGTLEARNELRRKNTRLVGSVAYFPERYGEDLVRLAINILDGKPVPSAVFAKHKLLTTQNVDLVYPLDGQNPAIPAHSSPLMA